MTGLALDRFDAVDLEQLIAEAALQTRVDRKYVVPRDDAQRVINTFDPRTRVLDTQGVRDFGYETVYFDTPDLLSFRLAAQPRRRRFKIRSRTYVESGSAYLELKTRGARSATVKDRIEYRVADRRILTDDARSYAADGLDAIGIDSARADDLHMRLTTRYRRATLVASDGSARSTIDTGLEWRDVSGRTLAVPGLTIIETKSGSAASDFDRALWRAGHRPVRISKYATGLAALHPDLPRNKWSRLLRGPLADAAPRPHTDPADIADTEETPCVHAA
ncbi:polyphosphate polymerase domain-containing protein [Microbacterium sp. ZOR0019]|uniref:polyphosphate polymerase domain-containing protein n=1 Tax=Microbacterium sp. ZOR0019 TaxID=1339233 RepID=UPI0006454E00|nr:polyphosphate polymerase domain-containing protein [Microbacterium sp. ZOR0019]